MIASMSVSEEVLLTVAQVAARWQLSEYTIRRYIKEGRLPAMKTPGKGRWRIRAEDAEAALGKPQS